MENNAEPVDALEHIMKTAQASRTQTRRLRWIAARAADALGLGGDWRDIDLPQSNTTRVRKELKKIITLKDRIASLEAQLTALQTEPECDRDCGKVFHMTGGYHRTDCVKHAREDALAWTHEYMRVKEQRDHFKAQLKEQNKHKDARHFTEVLATVLHQYENKELGGDRPTSQEMEYKMEGGMDRYRANAIYHNWVDRIVSELFNLPSPPTETPKDGE